ASKTGSTGLGSIIQTASRVRLPRTRTTFRRSRSSMAMMQVTRVRLPLFQDQKSDDDAEQLAQSRRVLFLALQHPFLPHAAAGGDQPQVAQRHPSVRSGEGADALLGEVGQQRGLVVVASLGVV